MWGGAGGSLSASYSQEVEISSCRTQSHLSQSLKGPQSNLNECFPITLGSTGYCLDRSCPWKTCTGMGLFSLNQKDPPTPTHRHPEQLFSQTSGDRVSATVGCFGWATPASLGVAPASRWDR